MYASRFRVVWMASFVSAASLLTVAGILIAQQAGRVPVDARRSLGKPVAYRNLVLIPVFDSVA